MLFGDYFKKMGVVQQLPMLYAVSFIQHLVLHKFLYGQIKVNLDSIQKFQNSGFSKNFYLQQNDQYYLEDFRLYFQGRFQQNILENFHVQNV